MFDHQHKCQRQTGTISPRERTCRQAGWLVAAAVLLLGSGTAGAAGPNEAAGSLFVSAREALANGLILKSDLVGLALPNAAFSECPPQEAVLIGFDLGLGEPVKGNEAIVALRPLYRMENQGEVYYQSYGLFVNKFAPGSKLIKSRVTRIVQLKAKPGYAVGAVALKTGPHLNSMALTFLRIEGNRLRLKDAYSSGWVGDQSGENEVVLSSNGGPCVGVFGHQNEQQVTALGLYYLNLSGNHSPPLADNFPALVSPSPSPTPVEVIRTGRGEELGGNATVPPSDLAARLKKSALPVQKQASEKREPAPPPEAAEEEEAAESVDWAWIALIGISIIAVPAIALVMMRVLRRSRAEKEKLRRGDQSGLGTDDLFAGFNSSLRASFPDKKV